MTRSLVRGDYDLVLVVESGSRQGNWYRQLVDRQTGALSCDCPAWINAGGTGRVCKHTQFTAQALSGQVVTTPAVRGFVYEHPLIDALQSQWQGLTGQWSLGMGHGYVGNGRYLVVLVRLETGNGDVAMGAVAFCDRFMDYTLNAWSDDKREAVVSWAGWSIAAKLAHRGGAGMAVGQPPEHYIFRAMGRRGAGDRLYLRDILRITDLRDGLTPAQRGENTLKMFFGEEYAVLEERGFLDVSSRFYSGRVYRLRRDRFKRHERRVRVFEHGEYTRDLCIVRGSDCPEPDWFLSVYFRLLSDERGLLSMLGREHIWRKHSDGYEREVVPAVWVAL